MTIPIELMLQCDISLNEPQEVIETLKYITRKEDYEFNNFPNHSYFQEESQNWRYILQSPKSAKPPNSYGNLAETSFQISLWSSNVFTLNFQSAIGSHKDLVELYFPFLLWLAPFVYETDQFRGFFSRIDVKIEYPTFIFFNKGKVHFAEIGQLVVEVTKENIWNFSYEGN